MRYEYDTSDRLIKQTDANGRVTQYEYNVRGQEVVRRLPGGQQWKTEYDLLGAWRKRLIPMVKPSSLNMTQLIVSFASNAPMV